MKLSDKYPRPVSISDLLTVSGYIVSQIPVLDNYATEAWVLDKTYINSYQLNTTSGYIINQIPSLAGYATQSWTNSNFYDQLQLNTISGNITTWVVSQNYISPFRLTTVSGDIIAQIVTASGGVSQDWVHNNFVSLYELTTTSGDIINYVSSLGLDLENVGVHILPEMTGASGNVSVRDIGSATRKFRNLYAHDAYIDAGSLYVNGKKVIEDVSDTITISTDPDQDLAIKTTATGDIKLLSDNTVGVFPKGGFEVLVDGHLPSKDINFSNLATSGDVAFTSAGINGSISLVCYRDMFISSDGFDIDSDPRILGKINVRDGITISGLAPTGSLLKSNGSVFVPGNISEADLPITIVNENKLSTTSGSIINYVDNKLTHIDGGTF